MVTFWNSIKRSNFQVFEMFDPIRVLDLWKELHSSFYWLQSWTWVSYLFQVVFNQIAYPKYCLANALRNFVRRTWTARRWIWSGLLELMSIWLRALRAAWRLSISPFFVWRWTWGQEVSCMIEWLIVDKKRDSVSFQMRLQVINNNPILPGWTSNWPSN